MTMMSSESVKCSRCGHEEMFGVILSTNTFGGSPDLDTRPPEMARSTMEYWVQECPNCGYVGDGISNSTTAPDELFESEEYLSCGGIAFQSELARRFYRLYLVKRAERKDSDAYWAALNSAWASDDAGDDESAVICRRLALEKLELMIAAASRVQKERTLKRAWRRLFRRKDEKESESRNYPLMKLDLLRRIREFDAVVEYASTLRYDDERRTKIVSFQTELANRRDAACHDCSETDDSDEIDDED